VSPARDDDLRDGLERALSERAGSRRKIVELERRSSAYASSFTLEELRAVLEDGAELDLIFKDVGPAAMSDLARRVKPAFLYDPLREIETYREVLEPAGLGTAHFYGATVDPDRDRCWLFLEYVEGAGLWQFGDLVTWEEAARWLAKLHSACARDTRWREATHLMRYDAGYYRVWLERARGFAAQDRKEASASKLDWLSTRYEEMVQRLLALPQTFIHGEFYASNILVDGEPAERVCPIDWEIAAVGPGLIDLAALVGGKWDDSERSALAAAYHAELSALGEEPLRLPALLEALDWCRLHLAVRWLGWARDWSPPREHKHDWLSEAVMIAEQLA
jgi:aminoglycoside phosphotransferase (APT) family kinase protein